MLVQMICTTVVASCKYSLYSSFHCQDCTALHKNFWKQKTHNNMSKINEDTLQILIVVNDFYSMSVCRLVEFDIQF